MSKNRIARKNYFFRRRARLDSLNAQAGYQKFSLRTMPRIQPPPRKKIVAEIPLPAPVAISETAIAENQPPENENAPINAPLPPEIIAKNRVQKAAKPRKAPTLKTSAPRKASAKTAAKAKTKVAAVKVAAKKIAKKIVKPAAKVKAPAKKKLAKAAPKKSAPVKAKAKTVKRKK